MNIFTNSDLLGQADFSIGIFVIILTIISFVFMLSISVIVKSKSFMIRAVSVIFVLGLYDYYCGFAEITFQMIREIFGDGFVRYTSGIFEISNYLISIVSVVILMGNNNISQSWNKIRLFFIETAKSFKKVFYTRFNVSKSKSNKSNNKANDEQ
jgi:ABC-type uncharacterized transport system YnjBCD permease subunit